MMRGSLHGGNMELKILTWIFPWLMCGLEFLLRASAGHPDAWGFIGPTLGAAALGMMLPLTHAGGSRDRVADHWAQSINVIVWIGLTAWAASVYLSVNHGSPYFPQIDGVRTSLLIGFILWGCAVGVDLARGGKS